MRMDVLDGSGGFVHENADGGGQAAERHDGLVWYAPERNHLQRVARNGMVTTTMAELRQVAQNTSTINPVRSAPKCLADGSSALETLRD